MTTPGAANRGGGNGGGAAVSGGGGGGGVCISTGWVAESGISGLGGSTSEGVSDGGCSGGVMGCELRACTGPAAAGSNGAELNALVTALRAWSTVPPFISAGGLMSLACTTWSGGSPSWPL
jgi:hypothetical protein